MWKDTFQLKHTRNKVKEWFSPSKYLQRPTGMKKWIWFRCSQVTFHSKLIQKVTLWIAGSNFLFLLFLLGGQFSFKAHEKWPWVKNELQSHSFPGDNVPFNPNLTVAVKVWKSTRRVDISLIPCIYATNSHGLEDYAGVNSNAQSVRTVT